MAVLLLSVLGGTLIVTTATETMVAASHRRSVEAFYAAEGALAAAVAELQGVPDWTGVLDGSVVAAGVDEYPGGTRSLSDGTTVDIGRVSTLLNCRSQGACTAADLVANRGGDRPWGNNNPVWRPYAYGPAAALLPGGGESHSPFYVVVLV